MVSRRTRLFEALIRAVALKRRLARIEKLSDDPDRLGRHLRTLRRFDRKAPPRSIRRSWHHEQLAVEGFGLHLLTRAGNDANSLILYLHGGGYLLGPSAAEWSMLAKVAAAAKTNFALFDYPKAPEHATSETIRLTAQAFLLLTDRHGHADVTLFGTSAGGGLALVLMTHLRDHGRPQPGRAILLSPAVDLSLPEDTSALEAGDAILAPAFVRTAGALYGPGLGLTHPDVSPTYADLQRLAPLHVFVGGAEILLPSTETFVARAGAAGIDVHLTIEEDQQHAWPTAPTPEGARTIQQMAEAITG